MRWRRLALGLAPTLPLFVVAGACSRTPARIGLVMRTPQGLLDTATSVELSVFPADQATCDGGTGHVSAIPAGDDTQKFALDRSGCPSGVTWCKDIELDQDGSNQMFAIIASNAGGILAEGCTVATIDQDPLEVSIQVRRYNPPPCCNDGALQVGEQCDFGVEAPMTCDGSPGGRCLGITEDPVCFCDCRAKEILLSIDDTIAPYLENGPAGSKSQLAIAFTPGDAKISNALRAVFRSQSQDDNEALGGSDINIRFLSQHLYPIEDPYQLSQQLRMPLECDDTAGSGLTNIQESPSITQIGTNMTGVTYTSGSFPSSFQVFLVAHSSSGCKEVCMVTDTACLARDTPVQLSEVGGAGDPDVAGGPPKSALAVWTRDGRVLGRIWTTDGELLPTAGEIDVAPSGQHARVAGAADRWVVVYQGAGTDDPDGILLKAIDPSGNVGPEIRVNAQREGVQDQPDVAMFPDGRAVVVWRSASDVFFQRYDAAGVAVPGDQDAPLNTTTEGEQAHPAAAASTGFGEFFAVAWEDVASGHVHARFPGASAGFLYNGVTGQNADFMASHPGIVGTRRLPAVAVGGAGFVAVGWQDEHAMHAGVHVRRLPLPTTQ